MSIMLTLIAWVLFFVGVGVLVWRLWKGDILGTSVVVLLLVALFFKVLFPGWQLYTGKDVPTVLGIAMVFTGRDLPLPVPSVAFAMYMGAALVGILVAASSNDVWLARFTEPIVAYLRRKGSWVHKAVLYGLLPALVSGIVLLRLTANASAPVESRQAHPSISYDEDAVSPYRTGAEVDPEALKEGREEFAKNCRPCHGMRADGVGPMARGFRLRPANFHDPGTIATLVEPYALQRVRDGGIGLPPNGSPWDSAMPRWKDDFEDDDIIWKILLAEYEIAGVNPRVPESE